MIRAVLSFVAFAAMLLTGVEARATDCAASLWDSYLNINIDRIGPCPQSDYAQSTHPNSGSATPFLINGSVAADIGAVAARSFWSGHAYSYGTAMNAWPNWANHGSLQCTLSGPTSPVLTRLAFEAEAAVSATKNGFDYETVYNLLTRGVAYVTASVESYMYFYSHLAVLGNDGTPYENFYYCDNTGVFSAIGCSGSMSSARQKYFTPQFSVPTGSIRIQVTSQAEANDYGIDGPVGTPNSASARAEVSLPADGSPVLDLPEGFTLDCENGTVIDNVWQGTPVSLPGPPPTAIPAPALSSAGHYALATAILSVAIAAIRSRRRA